MNGSQGEWSGTSRDRSGVREGAQADGEKDGAGVQEERLEQVEQGGECMEERRGGAQAGGRAVVGR